MASASDWEVVGPTKHSASDVSLSDMVEENLGPAGKMPSEVVILLAGGSVGKSAAANSLLGHEAFQSRVSSRPVTSAVQSSSAEWFGCPVKIIDTPGDPTSLQAALEKHPNISAVLFLVSASSRISDLDRQWLRDLEGISREAGVAPERLLMLGVTHTDAVDESSLEEFLQALPGDLQGLLPDNLTSSPILFSKGPLEQEAASNMRKQLLEGVQKLEAARGAALAELKYPSITPRTPTISHTPSPGSSAANPCNIKPINLVKHHIKSGLGHIRGALGHLGGALRGPAEAVTARVKAVVRARKPAAQWVVNHVRALWRDNCVGIVQTTLTMAVIFGYVIPMISKACHHAEIQSKVNDGVREKLREYEITARAIVAANDAIRTEPAQGNAATGTCKTGVVSSKSVGAPSVAGGPSGAPSGTEGNGTADMVDISEAVRQSKAAVALLLHKAADMLDDGANAEGKPGGPSQGPSEGDPGLLKKAASICDDALLSAAKGLCSAMQPLPDFAQRMEAACQQGAAAGAPAEGLGNGKGSGEEVARWAPVYDAVDNAGTKV